MRHFSKKLWGVHAKHIHLSTASAPQPPRDAKAPHMPRVTHPTTPQHTASSVREAHTRTTCVSASPTLRLVWRPRHAAHAQLANQETSLLVDVDRLLTQLGVTILTRARAHHLPSKTPRTPPRFRAFRAFDTAQTFRDVYIISRIFAQPREISRTPHPCVRCGRVALVP